jgi:hypothetical protein
MELRDRSFRGFAGPTIPALVLALLTFGGCCKLFPSFCDCKLHGNCGPGPGPADVGQPDAQSQTDTSLFPAFADPPRLEDLAVKSIALVDGKGACKALGFETKWSLDDEPLPMDACDPQPPAEPAVRCIYRWTDSDSEPDYQALEMGLPKGFTIVSSDYQAVMPLAPGDDGFLAGQVKGVLNESAVRSWDRVNWQIEGLSRDLVVDPVRASKVFVAVIDTAPGTPEAPSHGDTMLRLVQNLKCHGNIASASYGVDCQVDPECLDTVKLYPGLHCGDRSGTFSGVARAIVKAVDDWDKAPCGQRSRLVINLSLGWSWAYVTPAAETVHNALCYASSRGALILAATGNTLGRGDCDPDPGQGPLFPARWEKTDTARAYTDIGPDCGTFAVVPEGYAPMVHGITGLDDLFVPLANTRPNGITRAGVPGMQASVPQSRCQKDTGPMITGSSVSTAIASGLAALVWQYRPELTGPQVMDLVHGVGINVPCPPSAVVYPIPAQWFWGSGPAPTARSLSVGRSIWAANSCGQYSKTAPCYSLFPYEPAQPLNKWLPTETWIAGVFAAADAPTTSAAFPGPASLFLKGSYPFCLQPEMLGSDPAADMTYPDEVHAWLEETGDCGIDPQPGRIGCPDCSIAWKTTANQATVYMTPVPQDMTVETITLKVQNRAIGLTTAVCGASCPDAILSGRRFIVNVTNLPSMNPSAAVLVFAGRESPTRSPVSVSVPLIFLQ